jgi:hydroxymethylpyrimidine pyrophosphatase-like HAD family hydrolase
MRMVACDLDGTIVRPDGTVSQRTVAALAACEQVGVRVVFVTGRPPRWMASVAAATGHHGVAVCANGAIVYDLAAERVIATRGIPAADVHGIARAVQTAVPGGAFALETVHGFRREPGYQPRWPGPDGSVAPLDELLADAPVVLKMLYRLDRGTADDMLAAARGALHGLAEPVHSDAADSLLEIAALGVSKASTLAVLAEQQGLGPQDVVAFGDMPNDVPMLRWAGLGVAVADAHPEALAAASLVAPACLDDGVAQVVERLLAEQLPASVSLPFDPPHRVDPVGPVTPAHSDAAHGAAGP